MKLLYLKYLSETNCAEAAWENNGVRVKCRTYSGDQMNDLRADLGTEDSIKNADLINMIEMRHVPPPPQPVAIPTVVSAWQMRKALNQLMLRDAVETAVAASADQNLKDGWLFAKEFNRTDNLVVAMAASLGLVSADLDHLFILADSL
jgi:hypothetical protein